MALTPFTDNFTGTNGAAPNTTYWTTGSSGAGTIDIQSNQCRLLTPASSYNDSSLYPTSSYFDADFDVYFDLNFVQITAEEYFVFIFRYADGANYFWLQYEVQPQRWDFRCNVASSFVSRYSPTVLTSTSDVMHVHVRALGSTVQFRTWLNGATEPSTWDQTDTSGSLATAHAIMEFKHRSGGGGVAQTLYLDNVVMTIPAPSVPDAPTGLTAVGGVASAALTWTAPFNGGASITDYYVEYSSNGGSTWSAFSHTASTTTSITVTSLSNATACLFRVSAINSIGTGAASGTASAITADVPATMTAPLVDTPSHLGIHSFVTLPANNGASITDIAYRFSSDAGVTWTTWSHTAAIPLENAITGLTPGTYILQTASVNAVGQGSWSASSSNIVVKQMNGDILMERGTKVRTELNGCLETFR